MRQERLFNSHATASDDATSLQQQSRVRVLRPYSDTNKQPHSLLIHPGWQPCHVSATNSNARSTHTAAARAVVMLRSSWDNSSIHNCMAESSWPCLMRLASKQQHMMRGDDADDARFKTSHSEDEMRVPKLRRKRFRSQQQRSRDNEDKSPVHERRGDQAPALIRTT